MTPQNPTIETRVEYLEQRLATIEQRFVLRSRALLTENDILQAIAAATHIPADEILRSDRRSEPSSWSRYIFMHFLRTLLGLNYQSAALKANRKNPCTAWRAGAMIRDRCSIDPEFQTLLNQIKDQLCNSQNQ